MHTEAVGEHVCGLCRTTSLSASLWGWGPRKERAKFEQNRESLSPPYVAQGSWRTRGSEMREELLDCCSPSSPSLTRSPPSHQLLIGPDPSLPVTSVSGAAWDGLLGALSFFILRSWKAARVNEPRMFLVAPGLCFPGALGKRNGFKLQE